MKFKSQVYAQTSGSIGGITYSHNKGGMYTRVRATPTNPNTPRQQRVRASMGNIVSAWTGTLTVAQRVAWETYAQNVPVLNALGEMIQLTGQQHYLRSNVQRLVAGLGRVDDAPTIWDTGEVPNPGIDAQFTVNLSIYDQSVPLSAPASDDGDMLLFVYKDAIPASINFWKGPYQYAAKAAFALGDTAAVFAQDVTAAGWRADYVPANGDRAGARWICAFDDGRYSQDFKQIIDVVVT